MREILFRGKALEGANWVEGYLVREEDGKSYIVMRLLNPATTTCSDCGSPFMEYCEVDPATVGQFTVLTDKNGKRIFEGDIVQWGHAAGSEEMPIRIAEIRLNPDIQYYSQVGVFHHGNFAYARCTDRALEVIGNIHDNPELITLSAN